MELVLKIFQLTNRYRYQFVREVMTNILSTKEIINRVLNPWDSRGNEQMQFLFLLFPALVLCPMRI